MAGDWLKVELSTPDKPEIDQIAARLRITLGDAFLGCFLVWRWLDSQSEDGISVPGGTRQRVDREAHIPGFARAMEAVGWLEVSEGGLIFPRGDSHNGRTAKRRAMDAKRKSGVRNSSAKCPLQKRTERGPEKRREENKGASAPDPPYPPSLDTPRFREAWEAWVRHRRQKRQTLTEEAAKRQIKRLEDMGHDRAIAALEFSIANGWTGIFEPSGQSGGGDRRASAKLRREQRRAGEYAEDLSPETVPDI